MVALLLFIVALLLRRSARPCCSWSCRRSWSLCSWSRRRHGRAARDRAAVMDALLVVVPPLLVALLLLMVALLVVMVALLVVVPPLLVALLAPCHCPMSLSQTSACL
jgi:hypothetical protein